MGRPDLGLTLGGQLPLSCSWFPEPRTYRLGEAHGLCFLGVDWGGQVAGLGRAPSPPPCPLQTKEVLREWFLNVNL